MLHGMDYDAYGNEVGGPRPVALTAYFDGVARSALAPELAILADAAFGHCCRCRDFYMAESQQKNKELGKFSKFLGMEDGKRMAAARKAGYWHGKADHWNANAEWFHTLADGHRAALD